MSYEKKIPVDLDCPLRLTMSLIESKWKSCILDELRSGEAMRPSYSLWTDYKFVLRNSRRLMCSMPGYSLKPPLTGSIETTYLG